MGWDGIYALNRTYPYFEPGDEVFTETLTHKAITPNKPYTVIECKSKYPNHNILVITLITDGGYKSEYASYHFKKTERQIREDKINQILKEV